MATLGNWDDVINNVEVESFVGREHELKTFRQEIERTPPRYLVYYIAGQAGVGKTTLLARYRDIAKKLSFLLADCDEQQRDVPAVIGHFARQLSEQGFPLKHFDERFKAYRQKMHEIENDPQAPQGLSALIGRTMVRAAFIGGDLLPGLRKGLEYLPRESIETQASEWAQYLGRKFGGNKDEVELVRDPISILTPLFIQDLNGIAEKWQILLCFDNFQATRQELQEWILHLRDYKPSQNIRLAIAGQDLPGSKWEVLRRVTLTFSLDIFTQEEAEAFLDASDISDANRRSEIIEFSGRLPVLMSWLSAPGGQDTEPALPTQDIVERFLHWVPDPLLRQAALLAAIPRTFNMDILKLLLDDAAESLDIPLTFDWLLSMPFVKQRLDGWQYHSVVRRLMLRYQRQRSPLTYRSMHARLAEFYHTKLHEIGSSIQQEWANEEWRAYTLAYVYHFLMADPIKHWSELMSLFVVALRERRAFATEMIELLNSEDMRDELSREQKEIVELLREQLKIIEVGDLGDGQQMFEQLCNIPDLSLQANGYVHVYRGIAYLLKGNLQNALKDFDEALNLLPEDSWARINRGFTNLFIGRYPEALADTEHVISLDKEDFFALSIRGLIHLVMGRYLEALADIEQAISLSKIDELSGMLVAVRGAIRGMMGSYLEALTDMEYPIFNDKADPINTDYSLADFIDLYPETIVMFHNAISSVNNKSDSYLAKILDDKLQILSVDFLKYNEEALNAWQIGMQGLLHMQMNQYEEALVDLNQAIILSEQATFFVVFRGEVYRRMGRYEEALADFTQVIDFDDKFVWLIVNRGRVYELLERYEEALAEFELAIALDNNLKTILSNEYGLILSYLGSYSEAIDTYNIGLKEDPNSYLLLYNVAVAMARWKNFPDAQENIDKARDVLLRVLDTSERGAALYGLGGIEALVGNDEQALDYLQQSIGLEKRALHWARHDIAWRDLQTDPRFQLIVSAVG